MDEKIKVIGEVQQFCSHSDVGNEIQVIFDEFL
jgi:hypothetical protein